MKGTSLINYTIEQLFFDLKTVYHTDFNFLVNDAPTTKNDIIKRIEVWEEIGWALPAAMWRCMEEYRVLEKDVRDLITRQFVISVSNASNGPYIIRDGVRGFGLFADRTYEPLEGIVEYGGVWETESGTEGDYVIEVREENGVTCTVNGYYHFKLGLERGRWINEYSSDKEEREKHCNVIASYDSENKVITFGAKKRIERGEQLFWDYGDNYNRKY